MLPEVVLPQSTSLMVVPRPSTSTCFIIPYHPHSMVSKTGTAIPQQYRSSNICCKFRGTFISTTIKAPWYGVSCTRAPVKTAVSADTEALAFALGVFRVVFLEMMAPENSFQLFSFIEGCRFRARMPKIEIGCREETQHNIEQG